MNSAYTTLNSASGYVVTCTFTTPLAQCPSG